MSFKIIKSDNKNFSTPQEMFQDNKMKNIIGLIDYQSKMIDYYMQTMSPNGEIHNKHVAFELPTGSGKTLIGLLIGEFHRRKYHRKVLFLCPTNQLVQQVCSQAKSQYGIETVSFCGTQASYSSTDRSDFLLCNKIGVTTYSSFFATSQYFDGTEILIFDDVHSSEQYISDSWSINIQREEHKVLYNELMEIIKGTDIGDSFYSRMSAENPFMSDVKEWCNMIPMPLISGKIDIIERVITTNVEETTLKYSWSRIRDHLGECNIFVSWDSILIRPYIIPTQSFQPFKNALQCIFMSATLGKSGELERVTGVEKIKRLPIANEWDKKGIGRKFFVFPDLSFEAKRHLDIMFDLHNTANKSVVITPSIKEQELLMDYAKLNLKDTNIYKAEDLITYKDDFKKDSKAMVIIANRFDGIDFPDDESRLLILYNLSKVTHLQEKFFYSKMAASILYSERVKTRIVQAVGRCTRNAKDYAVVCILGDSILNDLITNNNLVEYKPEMRAEIQFGIDNSINLSDVSEIIENVKMFLLRDPSWNGAEEHIVSLRDKYILESDNFQNNLLYDKLHSAAQKEVRLQYDLWKKDYEKAFNIVCEIISMLNAPKLRGYQSFWQYFGGNIALQLGEDFQSKAHNLFKDASQGVLGVSWMASLANLGSNKSNEETEDYFDSNIERLEHALSSHKTAEKLERKITEVLEGLTSSTGENFERHHCDLGKLLGYMAVNPTEDSSPDPYWLINDDVCIVAEDKIYESSDKKIPTDHVSQAKRHETWIRNNVETLHKEAKVYTVFITNSETITEDAKIHGENVYYCSKNELIKWANKSLTVLRDCYNLYNGEGDSEWRMRTKEEFIKNEITPFDFIKLITKRQLKDL